MDVDATRRRRFLDTVLDGKRELRNLIEARLLVAAICDERDRLRCIAKLCSKENRLTAARQALLTDLSSDSLNHHAAKFVLYFSTEDLRQVAGGKILCDLLSPIIKPALLWNAYKTSAAKYELTGWRPRVCKPRLRASALVAAFVRVCLTARPQTDSRRSR